MRLAACLLLLGLIAGDALAAADYAEISPASPRGARVEVTEFFYYGCEGCAAFEPFFASWLAGHPEIDVTRVPALRPSWLPLAKTYYALAEMGVEDKLRAQIYAAAGTLVDENDIFSFLAQQGVDMEKFRALYESDEIGTKIVMAAEDARRFSIAGTPSLVVDGRYLVLGNLARPELLDRLVGMAAKLREPQIDSHAAVRKSISGSPQ